MRLNVNLATVPYQDVRRFLRQWGTATGIVFLCTVALVWYAIALWLNTREVNQQIAQMQTETRQAQQERAAAIAMLQRPENRSIVEQSHFLNDEIAKKSFSWTRVFMTLEKILPPHLHMVAIAPELASTRQLMLHMTVAGSSRDEAEELVRRLETSPTFQNARLRSESVNEDPKQGSDKITFEISAEYVAQAPAPAAAVAEQPKTRPVPGREAVR